MKTKFLPLLASLIILANLSAVEKKKKGKRSVNPAVKRSKALIYENENGDTLPYRFLPPENYDPKKKYPLVLVLHGAGCRGDDNRKNLGGIIRFGNPRAQKKHPCFVLAPQCPKNDKWADVNWGDPAHTQSEKPTKSMQMVIEVLKKTEKDYPVDPERIYVMGRSMGGYGTWDIITRYPQKFAAAVPICGGADETKAQRISHMAIWVFHGEKDPVVKVERSRNMVKALEKAGGNPKYTEFEGVGHNSWKNAYRVKGLHEWIFSQKKNTGNETSKTTKKKEAPEK